MKAKLMRLRPELLLLGLLVAIAATWPVALHLGTHLPGSEQTGAYSHVWKYWWTGVALLEQGTNPAHTDLINYPDGFSVGRYMAGFGNSILFLPVTRFFGPVTTFNAVFLVNTAAGFWAAALLATWSGLSRWPAAFVGLGWSLCPNHLGFFMGGAVEYAASPWVPLFLLLLLLLLDVRAVDGPPDQARPSQPLATRANVLAALGLASFLLLTATSSWMKGMMLGLFGGAILVVVFAARRFRADRGVAWAAVGLALGVAAVVFAAWLTLPSTPQALTTHLPVFTADPARLHMSWKHGQPESTVLLSREMWVNNHLILTLGLLALVGGLNRRGRLWLLLSLPFLLDILVPRAWVMGWSVHVPESLASVLSTPAMILSTADKRVFPVHLLLALSAGHGLMWLMHHAQRWRAGAILAIVACVAWTAESVWTGPVSLPVPSFEAVVPPHTRFLATAEPGAVINLPLMAGEGATLLKAVRSRYLYEQTIHSQPVLTSVGSRMSYGFDALPKLDPVLETLHWRGLPGGADTPPPARWSPASLLAAGYRWIVLHPAPLPTFDPAAHARLASDLDELLGEPYRFDDGVLVYRIAEP